MNNAEISTMISGISTDLPEATKRMLEKNIRELSTTLEKARNNRNTNAVLGIGKNSAQKTNNTSGLQDTEMFTTISEMINGNTRDFAGFGTLMDNLYAKNKKYFSILKDYETMPILIPQINRVLMFLVNECLSPDIQNEQTFTIQYTGQDTTAGIQGDIDSIKKEMKLDNLLREVYTNRYKLGRELYIVEDYNTTFDHMLDMLQKKRLNEDTAQMSDIDYIDHTYSGLVGRIDECSAEAVIASPMAQNRDHVVKHEDDRQLYIKEATIKLDLSGLNIVIERSPVVSMLEAAHAELLAESYSKYSTRNLFRDDNEVALNEASSVDTSKMEQLVTTMRKKKLQRCTIVRFDPARIFKLKVGGKVIGYFYVTDINESTSNMVNFAQSLKDQLMKTRAANLSAATQSAEEVVAKELAQKIINTFDPNLGINRVEDIDLMHDFIRQNEIYKGNKKITFYYADEIFDMSRSDDSILINAVFFTKLYATLMLNNIVTKVLRGRGRQIHTVKIGVSPNIRRYIDNAMASLAMPETNLGTLHGSFEQIMNPFNGASDIVIPTDDDEQQYIKTDYIPGQDVDMNDEFLKFMLNSIITAFGLDAAVLDATNGNLQFARTLSMESLQISNSIKNEQQDVYDSWSAMCLRVLSIMGNEATRNAVENGQIEIRFFEPKSLIIQNIIDDINNAKNLAESIADIIPEFNEEDSDQRRNKYIYQFIKTHSNFDFSGVEEIIADTKIASIDDVLMAAIREVVREYMENTKEVQYGDTDGDGVVSEEDAAGENNDDYDGGGDSDLTSEEEELMSMPDENDEGDDDI